LDIFGRLAVSDYTDGAGTTKLTDSLVLVPLEDMVHPVYPSPIATYLHDDPDFFRNDRLASDEQVYEIAKKNRNARVL
jgi:hypothetical protein